MAQRFTAGHQIWVSVSTSYWPLAWLPLGTWRNLYRTLLQLR
ncbi:CocE/NonD family hydrolase C-terminal non-catalytic domain-containing protein [Billgrantia montanilacus]|nr:CocE/NonD family hydrolase C-terminal non-catalytic domain-containing protein [Halomonas montanilacus]